MSEQLVRLTLGHQRVALLRFSNTSGARTWQCLLPGVLAFNRGTWQAAGDELFVYGQQTDGSIMRMMALYDRHTAGHTLTIGVRCFLMNNTCCDLWFGTLNSTHGSGRVFENCFLDPSISAHESSSGGVSWQMIGPTG